ncbi:MAG TPA: glycoside hydrolase family 2 TIM barrel-domain containing protein, partial [Tepidisphaeraceae bacterium]|nr:glycoside hydrolase family 2 TIM barrel-domain containing protein [Tepidisphaeraceae bacterium]
MQRITTILNSNWRFHRGECPTAAAAEFDDTHWQRIGLPHCFDAPYFRTPEFYVGEGWYRREVDLGQNLPTDRRVTMEFDGVFQRCDVFVDGTHAGSHQGGYTGFSIDITPAINRPTPIIAIRVDNRWNPQLAPRAGEHIFSGGIYRDVRLVITHPIHIAWCGHAIATPEVAFDRASVAIETAIVNSTDTCTDCLVTTEIFDPHGRCVGLVRDRRSVPPGKVRCVVRQSTDVADPMLWCPAHPYLYRARTTVSVDEIAVDMIEETFGIRTIRWTSDAGFFLNGEHLYLRGANVHQDHAGWGIGITRAACERDVRLMKEAGFNFIRGAHYPHHPAFADACDRLGILFWSEATFWGKGGFGPEGFWNASAYPVNQHDEAGFEQSCVAQLEEMIRINRNHPSIICWSMTNEAFFTYHLDRAKALMEQMVSVSRTLDPTRPAAIGGAQRGGIDRIGDVAGYNGDGARLFMNPGVPNMVSEYGAIGKPPDAFDPFFGDLQPEKFPW